MTLKTVANQDDSNKWLDHWAELGWTEVVSMQVTQDSTGNPQRYVFLLTKNEV